jgi:hypothetical protein
MSIFWWGCLGSLAVEIITIFQILCNEPITFPERYKTLIFYFIRILVILIAGGLVVAYNIDKPIVAINLGASAPSHFFGGAWDTVHGD